MLKKCQQKCQSMSRLEQLERAEDLVISLLECAASSVKELKEIQANSDEKQEAFLQSTEKYLQQLCQIKEIIFSELETIDTKPNPSSRREGIDQLAIANWEAQVIADNIHELYTDDPEQTQQE